MKPFTVVLTGNPNCGKTTLFNALTGLRGRVGNYAGVTVERKEGSLTGADARFPVTLLDLPGTYSLSPQSPDEQIARDILFQRVADVPAPDLVVVVVDASNLQRNLYFATQVIELGHPTLLTLNMVDVARDRGHDIDTDALSKALGVPVIPMVASQGEGLEPLRQSIRSQASSPGTRHVIPREFNELPEAFGREAQAIETALERHFPHRSRLAAAEALLLLSDERALPTDKTNTDGNTNGNTAGTRYPSALIEQVLSARRRLEAAGVDWRSTAIEARYARLFAIEQHVTRETPPPDELLSDRIDRVVTHRVWGPHFCHGDGVDVPVHLLAGEVSHGRHRGGCRCPGPMGRLEHAPRRSQRPDHPRRYRRCRVGGDFPPSNLPALPLHRPAGRHRLHV